MGSRNAATKHSSSKPSSSAAKRDAGRGKGTLKYDSSNKTPLVDSSMREDLIGVALAVIGIALFICVLIPGDAVASLAISNALKLTLGLAAYIVPFVLVFWGATFFLKTEGTKVGRLIIGVLIILISLMSLFSLFAPSTLEALPSTLFSEETLINGGGYIGSGISWALMSLFGRLVSSIILIGLCVAGLVIAGLSISKPILILKNFIFQKQEDKLQERYQREIYGNEPVQYEEGLADNADLLANESTQALEETVDESPLTRLKKKFAVPTDDESEYDEISFVGIDDLDPNETIDLNDLHSIETITLEDDRPSKPKARALKTTRLDRDELPDPEQDLHSAKTTVLKDGTSPSALEGFVLPDPRILSVTRVKRSNMTSELRQMADQLQQTLEEFNLPAKVVGWLAGPTVTMYKVELPTGVRLKTLTGLADDIALSLAADSVRIAQIPNTSLVGVEIPNKTRSSVLLGDILSECGSGPLKVAIGEDVDGEKIAVDLAPMPHLLIAGTTGSGKSICLKSMIMSMIMRSTPAEVRMILIDPKRVEMTLFNGIPHLYVPPVIEPKEAASALKWAVAEMDRRLKVFSQVGATNIGFYNQMIQNGDLTDDNGDHPAELPYIVVVIDELADLMMVAGKEVEDSIVRLAQVARAAGIHLIIATQRPSTNIVTGMIKANIVNRIGLMVATQIDSRVILDTPGAEKLVGHGDMLFDKPEWGKPKRIQGCFVSDDEISSVVEHLKTQGAPSYHPEILQQQISMGSGSSSNGFGGATSDSDDDPLLWDAAEAVVSAGLGSTSMLQRRLKVGYARAGRIMDMLENKGIVGPQEGSRARDVLIDSIEDLDALRFFDEQDNEEGF